MLGKPLFFPALLAAILASPGHCRAQAASFEELYRDTALFKQASAFTAPAQARAAAAPETSYENLIAAPVWKKTAQQPAASDLREGFTAARYQGNRNLCNAFAASALAEYLLWKKDGSRQDLSEEFLYYNTKLNFTGTPDLQAYKAEPGLPGYAAVQALRGGVVAEAEWPFQAALPPHTPVPPLTDPDLGVPPVGIAGKVLPYAFRAQALKRTEIKDFLAAESRPVVMNLMLYFGNIDNATGRLTQPNDGQRRQCASKGDNCGGHVVLITGYDPQAKEYIFRNSWGEKWGDRGYGRMPEAYVTQDCESCGHLTGMASYDVPSRTQVINAAYGWSAILN